MPILVKVLFTIAAFNILAGVYFMTWHETEELGIPIRVRNPRLGWFCYFAAIADVCTGVWQLV